MPIASFDWSDGEREDTYHTTDFCPVLAWTDGITDGLRVRENRTEGAVLAPFNVITGSWWDAGLDSDVLVNPNTSASEGNAIPVADVKAADADGDGEVTTEEMRSYDGDGDGRADYPSAILRTVDLYYKLSHGISGSETGLADPLVCADCHGESATHIDWAALGYDSDPAETDPPTNFSAVTIDVTIPDAKPAEKEREPAF
jgi:methanogenesis multiheme c-type cytochrome